MRILRRHWKLAAISAFSLSIAMALGIIGLSASNTFLILSPAAPAADRLVMIYARSDTEGIVLDASSQAFSGGKGTSMDPESFAMSFA